MAERHDGEVLRGRGFPKSPAKRKPFEPLSRLRRQLPLQGSYSEGAYSNGRGADALAQPCRGG